MADEMDMLETTYRGLPKGDGEWRETYMDAAAVTCCTDPNHKHGVSQEELWEDRIEAAIEKAEKLVEEAALWKTASTGTSPIQSLGSLGPDTVALAKALWKSRCPDSRTDVPNVHDIEVPCPRETALRAFCKKVEKL